MNKKLKEVLCFYRIINWENKISGIRPIGYTFFGYLMAGRFDLLLIFLNTLVILGALAFWYSLDDYFDWKIKKESNYLSLKIQNKELSEKQALASCFLPLIFCLFLFYIIRPYNLLPLYLFLAIFFLTLAYSLPPIRLKQIIGFRFLVPPLGALILFLQAYSLFGNLTQNIVLLAVLIFIFHLYLETLHVLDDSLAEKIMDRSKILKLLSLLPFVSLIFSLCFSLVNCWFLITSIFSLIRFLAVRRMKAENVHGARTGIFAPVLSLYEFGIYGVLGILHLF